MIQKKGKNLQHVNEKFQIKEVISGLEGKFFGKTFLNPKNRQILGYRRDNAKKPHGQELRISCFLNRNAV